MICRPYDVAIVPFPFSERFANKRRPALALSYEAFGAESGHTVFAMITSSKNPPWPLDVKIDAAAAGLHAESKVRMKFFTLDNRVVLGVAGTLKEEDRVTITRSLVMVLALTRLAQ